MKLRDVPWSVIVLAALAAAFLLVAGLSSIKSASAAAGFAFAGATVTRAVSFVEAHRREKALSAAQHGIGLDETRRLAYMVLLVGKTEKYELVATVANAMAHHNLGVSFDQAVDRLTEIANGKSGIEGERWLRDKIDEIGHKIADA